MAQHALAMRPAFEISLPHMQLRTMWASELTSGWLSANNIESFTGLNESQIEYIIPRELFDQFNLFLRYPWDPWK
jgi:hypothetical protein